MAKIIRCAGNDDVITLKTGDDADTVTFVFESPSKYRHERSSPTWIFHGRLTDCLAFNAIFNSILVISWRPVSAVPQLLLKQWTAGIEE